MRNPKQKIMRQRIQCILAEQKRAEYLTKLWYKLTKANWWAELKSQKESKSLPGRTLSRLMIRCGRQSQVWLRSGIRQGRAGFRTKTKDRKSVV